MSLVGQIEVELNRTRERLAKLTQMKELAVEVERPEKRENVGASKPEPTAQMNGGGTLGGRILEALNYGAARPKGLAKKLEADVEEVKAAVKVLVAQDEVTVERGGTLRRI